MRKRKKSDPRSEYVAKLHFAYTRGQLNIFVGAGLSQQSGFPGWDSLNRNLVRNYLNKEIGTSSPAALIATESLESKTDDLYAVLGRDAAADFVRQGVGKGFGQALAQALFQGRRTGNLPLKSAHHQIVALSDKARLFTLNYDPLLELALQRRFPRRSWTAFRSPDEKGRSLNRRPRVEHLHGWLDAQGTMSNEVVLTQSDYFELATKTTAKANKSLKRMLTGKSSTLILGMSLADPNFRRVLYFLNKEGLGARQRIFVVMQRDNPAVDHYMQVHWGNSGLRLLFVERYDDIPGLLRDVQWGTAREGTIPKWTNHSIDWRHASLPDPVVFTNEWQEIAHKSLHALTEKIARLFGVPQHEKLNAALFIPFRESRTLARLRMVASSRKVLASRGALFRARRRVLSISRGREQGIAGVCFSSGTERAIAFGEGQVDVNFTSEMSENWISSEGYRDWRSIVAVPVIDTDFWVPVAVVTLTSNQADPFWKGFGDKQVLLQPELYTAMRQAGHFAIVGFGSAI
jgi:hypothetical protein